VFYHLSSDSSISKDKKKQGPGPTNKLSSGSEPPVIFHIGKS